MKEESSCQVCGAPLVSGAPAGLCPACLFGAGLEDETIGEPGEVDMVAEKPGDIVGRYRLEEKIGEGGFGVVFRAEQQVPVKRIVALKVIKPGMDTKEVVARFQVERQALALMEHPCIARVYDAGTTERGRPYFVMELVDGQPLTSFCDEAKLDMRERLKLFAQVCRAVQHAHQKGVIHRDLKPSNILVREGGDGTPVPKIIDFGVAKAISIELTEKTFFTMFGRMVGTPRYMSPEQAELNAVDVDTRSDIYALGIVLYELVTGRAPLGEKEFSSASFDELRRMIREDDPLKPSARVLIMPDDERRTAAKARGLDQCKFRRYLGGDLDWIVMKALEKERNRRYNTAHELAVDVRRFLRHLPVLAGPPGPAYRIGKFVRRHRGGVIISSLVLLSLVGGMILMAKANRRISDEWKRKEYGHLELLVEGISKRRASDQGSRQEALMALHEVGTYELQDLGLSRDDQAVLRARARNELIACLDWTDLQEKELSDEVKNSWVPAAMDSAHERWALHEMDGRLVVHDASGKDYSRDGSGTPVERALLQFSPDGALVAAPFGTDDRWELVIWNWAKGQDVVTGVAGVHAAFDFHPGGDAFAVGTADLTVEILKLDGSDLRPPLALGGIPRALRFSPSDGAFLAVATKESGVELFDVATSERVWGWPRVTAASLAWAPDGDQLAVGEAGGEVTVLERGSPRSVFSAREHGAKVDQLAWSHDGRLIASGSPGGEIRLWDGRQGELLCKYTAWARNLSFSADDGSGALELGPVLTPSRTLSTLVVKRDPVCHQAAGHSAGRITAAAWVADGAVFATAGDDGLRLWNWKGRQLKHFRDVRVSPGGLAGSATHLYLSTGSRIERRAISIVDRKLIEAQAEPLGAITDGKQIVLSPDGRTLAVACDREVVLLDLTGGTKPRRLPAPESTAFLAISPDGDWLAAGTRGANRVRIWRMTPSPLEVDEVDNLTVHEDPTVAFYPCLRAPGPKGPGTGPLVPPLLMTGDKQSYQLWNWDPGAERWIQEAEHANVMDNPEGRLAKAVFSPRGTVVVVAYERRLLRVLDARKVMLMTQPGFKEQWPLAIDPNGRMMVTEAVKGRLFIWNLEKVMEKLRDYNLDWREEGVALPGFLSKPAPVVEP